MAKKPKKAESEVIEHPEVAPEAVGPAEKLEAPTEVMVVLSVPFRLNGKLYPAGRPVRVPADASHHMPVKTRL